MCPAREGGTGAPRARKPARKSRPNASSRGRAAHVDYREGERIAGRLLSLHNLAWVFDFVARMRQAIEAAIGSTYTFDTISYLKRRCPGVHFVWLMGADNFHLFDRWQRWRNRRNGN